MKKIFITVIILFGINTFVFSQTEMWLSFGFEYGNFWERSSDSNDSVKGYIGSPGINLNLYTFWNNGIVGLFLHDIFAFPVKMTTEFNGVKSEVDLKEYDFIIQAGIIIGPGFRYNVTNKFKLQFGIGISYLLSFASNNKSTGSYGDVSYSVLTYNLGIGGDIGIKYDITDIFYFNIGSIVGWDFLNYSVITTSFASVYAFSKNYSMIHLRPYICVGFNININ